MKKVLIVLMLAVMVMITCGCNKANSAEDLLSTHESSMKAYIHVNGHTVIVDVDKYMLGSNGIIKVFGKNGTSYKTHCMNVVLVKNESYE